MTCNKTIYSHRGELPCTNLATDIRADVLPTTKRVHADEFLILTASERSFASVILGSWNALMECMVPKCQKQCCRAGGCALSLSA